jgi:hypothetical protein
MSQLASSLRKDVRRAMLDAREVLQYSRTLPVTTLEAPELKTLHEALTRADRLMEQSPADQSLLPPGLPAEIKGFLKVMDENMRQNSGPNKGEFLPFFDHGEVLEDLFFEIGHQTGELIRDQAPSDPAPASRRRSPR